MIVEIKSFTKKQVFYLVFAILSGLVIGEASTPLTGTCLGTSADLLSFDSTVLLHKAFSLESSLLKRCLLKTIP
jgi:hypothetical protein